MTSRDQPTSTVAALTEVVVIGGANVDLVARSSAPIVPATSNPGAMTTSSGGVGRNIAENLARLGTPTALVSAIGLDSFGEELVRRAVDAGIDLSALARTQTPTGTYTAVLDADGELLVAIADMAAADQITPEVVAAAAGLIEQARVVVVDGNLPAASVAEAIRIAHRSATRVVFEPVSVPKAARLADVLDGVWLVTPNREELTALAGFSGTIADQTAALHARGIERVWVRMGTAGSLWSMPTATTTLSAIPAEVVDVTGAGDAMLAAMVHWLLRDGDELAAAAMGHLAAALTVAAAQTVRSDISEVLIEEMMGQ